MFDNDKIINIDVVKKEVEPYGSHIYFERKRKGLTLKQKAGIDLSVTYLSKIENNRVNIPKTLKEKLINKNNINLINESIDYSNEISLMSIAHLKNTTYSINELYCQRSDHQSFLVKVYNEVLNNKEETIINNQLNSLYDYSDNFSLIDKSIFILILGIFKYQKRLYKQAYELFDYLKMNVLDFLYDISRYYYLLLSFKLCRNEFNSLKTQLEISHFFEKWYIEVTKTLLFESIVSKVHLKQFEVNEKSLSTHNFTEQQKNYLKALYYLINEDKTNALNIIDFMDNEHLTLKLCIEQKFTQSIRLLDPKLLKYEEDIFIYQICRASLKQDFERISYIVKKFIVTEIPNSRLLGYFIIEILYPLLSLNRYYKIAGEILFTTFHQIFEIK